MKYTNTKTGAVIDTPCKISGGDWIESTKELEEVTKELEEIEEIEEAEIIEDDFEGITVKEIKQELDAMGIKYDPKAKKQELYNLMFKGR